MGVLMIEMVNLVFHNKVIDGTTMKRVISILIDHFGMAYTSHILDQVKTWGWLVQDAEQQSLILEKHHHYGNVHAIEKLRQSIDIWYATSEYLRQEMNTNFRMTNPFNPVHIMSFSGARGNASQVHRLVGMRGLMSNPQGQMIDLPIQSNLCEGLSLTEYIISCYGAHIGYLMHRLVEVVQHIVVRRTDCGIIRGIRRYIYGPMMHRHSKSRYWDWACQSIHNLSSTDYRFEPPLLVRTHARAHAHTHTHIYTYVFIINIFLVSFNLKGT
ncbi:hypothetical protein PVL29_017214 [Vitis rotundifolia]|uniref:DNA-directed RNA polymerase n=1 Tax=Vitis rotundifolia TaxID=103349 RepID=A0AA38Z9V6_VITRO|nr:hypothetical protein PVL29_017214 [Vitis rotundifolia]